MKYPKFEEIGAQKLMHTITRSIGRITELYLYSDFLNFITNTMQLAVVFVIISHFSIKIALLTFVIIPVLYGVVRIFSGKVGKSSIAGLIPDINSVLSPESEQSPNQIENLPRVDNIIYFNNVTFSYGRGDFSLKIKELRINKGEFVAIVGTSGGGKTSLLDILNGFYPVKDGSIKFYNEELPQINPNSLRELITCVFQDVYVFNKSVAENISYPDKPDKERINYVIKKAALSEFIESLPEKEETVISDLGSNFSVGECQRISLARAFYKDSDIFLFDEPTAALDAVTSENIFASLVSECNEMSKTVITITHDIGKALLADKVVVIDNGVVEDIGEPEELLNHNGKFSLLYDAYLNLSE